VARFVVGLRDCMAQWSNAVSITGGPVAQVETGGCCKARCGLGVVPWMRQCACGLGVGVGFGDGDGIWQGRGEDGDGFVTREGAGWEDGLVDGAVRRRVVFGQMGPILVTPSETLHDATMTTTAFSPDLALGEQTSRCRHVPTYHPSMHDLAHQREETSQPTKQPQPPCRSRTAAVNNRLVPRE
jgi:hypothetical protein